MTSAVAAPMATIPLAFYQNRPSSEPLRLEVFTRHRAPDERHFYASNVTLADFDPVLAPELRGLEAILYRLPPSLLNANYWEPYSREAEAQVRERMTGLITRQEGERTQVWRSDAVAPGRLLRDGLEIPVELVLGYAFRAKGEDVPALGRAWAEAGDLGRERFEFVAFSSLPAGEALRDRVLQGHNDLTAMRLAAPDARLAFAAQGRHVARAVFTTAAAQRKCVASAIRGFAVAATGAVVAPPNDRVCDQVLGLAEGLGLTCDAGVDLLNRGRSFEFKMHLGRTEWGLTLPPGHEPPPGEAFILLYYDRIAGLWAVAR